MGETYRIVGADSDADLRGILALQSANLPHALTPAERAGQGFVTLTHDLALLREMNAPWPHVIAKRGSEVVGYALVTLPSFRARLPLLEPMFTRLEQLAWRGRPLAELRHYVMGQVCVAHEHRGRGLFERLYDGHRRQMGQAFELCVTEVASANPRSLRAHAKVGFVELDVHEAEPGSSWAILALELGRPRP